MNTFDYVIVGAGSAGCVLAAELSRNPACSVLLLEAGPPDASAMIRMPRGIGKLLDPLNPHVWHYRAGRGAGRDDEDWLKGRTLGGSSSVNGMVWMRGLPSEYDDWEAMGCTGWGWRDVGRCLKSVEDHELGQDAWRGAGGPLRISMQPADNPLYEPLLEAAVQAGIPRVADVNAAFGGGIGYQPRTIWRGQRQSTATAFLQPARQRPNLTVRTGVSVQRVVFEGTRAVGVALHDAAGASQVRAAREVILCAGALHSPKLLQLSGVGPAGWLQPHGIAVVADRAEVGRHLLEHRGVMMKLRLREGGLNREFAGWRLGRNLLRYATSRAGPMTTAAHELCALVKTRPELARPDAELGIGLWSIALDEQGRINVEREPGMTWVGYFTTPDSEGSVRITSPDPAARPAVDANYLATERDRRHAIDLVRLMRRIVAQPALAPHVAAEVEPGPAFQRDDELVDAYLRHGCTGYHVAGTCRMGADDAAVVDPQLRVRGVQGLRVADTSVMPTLISGNTNAPAIAIGLRAAELLRSAHHS